MNNEENRVTPKLTSNKFDLREVRVHASSVIVQLIEFLQPATVLIYGGDNFDLNKSLEGKYHGPMIYEFDPTAKKCENLPIDKAELVLVTEFQKYTSEDEFIKMVERILKISKNVIFNLYDANTDEVNSHCKHQELLKKYFPTITVLTDLNHLCSLYLTFEVSQEIRKQCEILLHGKINYIDSLKNLVSLLQDSEDVIFMPGLRGGKAVSEWLEFSGNLEYVDCFAETFRVSETIDTLFEKNLPLLHPQCLLHYRETGNFIVAVNPILHGETYKTMTNLGFKNLFFLGVNTYNEIVEELKKIMTPDHVMQRFMNYVTDKLNKLEMVIGEQNEIYAVNGAAFEKYRNFFRGRKVVVVAGGPTVNYYKPITDAIHIGVNYAWRKKDIPMDFLFTNDVIANDDKTPIRMEHGFDKIKQRVFIGRRLQHITDRVRYDYPIDISLKKDNVSVFFLEPDTHNRSPKIYQDICRHPVAHFRTTVFNAIHFALFTCPAELYLVGCDVSLVGHFYSSDPYRFDTRRTKVAYARMKAFASHCYPGTKIISVNPVNLKGLFTDIYTDEYKKSLENK